MAKPKVVITNWIHEDIAQQLDPVAEIVANKDRRRGFTHAEILKWAPDAVGLVTFMTDHVHADFLDQLPNLKIISCALRGYDNFDVAACHARGITLTHVPDLLQGPTAELTIGLMIGLGRHMGPGDRFVRSGDFAGWRPQFYGRSLAESTVGFVGFGELAKAIAQRLKAFGSSMIYHDVERLSSQEETAFEASYRPFSQLLSACDFVVLTVPLTSDTAHLIGRREIDKMRADAILINPARGSIVDEEAVCDALNRGRLGGYAADVFACEDWALPNKPKTIPAGLLHQTDRTQFTPHLGSAVESVRRGIAQMAVDNVIAVLEGREPDGLIEGP